VPFGTDVLFTAADLPGLNAWALMRALGITTNELDTDGLTPSRGPSTSLGHAPDRVDPGRAAVPLSSGGSARSGYQRRQHSYRSARARAAAARTT
jgi:hypothetical protein